jgi:hypothetical protein
MIRQENKFGNKILAVPIQKSLLSQRACLKEYISLKLVMMIQPAKALR